MSSSVAFTRDLVECTKLLASDKATERKKCIDQLLLLLKNNAVIDIIDQNSDRQNGTTWDALFKSVKSCISKEAQQLEKDSQKTTALSSATLTNRDRKRKACGSLIRLVISKANSRGLARIETNGLINHVLEMMQNEFLWSSFAVDYSNILLKDILCHRQITRNISHSVLEKFLEVYVDYYKRSMSDSHHGLIMQIMDALIRLNYFHNFINASPMFTFFGEVFKNCRTQLSLTQQEKLMMTCLSFCKAVATDCRHQLCYFGELVSETVLLMFCDNLSKTFKTVIIEFLQLQMACHHPNGAMTEESGALMCDNDLWQECVHALYVALLKELQKPTFKTRHNKIVILDMDVLELVVDVFYHNIIKGGQKDVSADYPSSKRKKSESCFLLLVENLRDTGTDTDTVIPWLQVVGGLFAKYPKNLSLATEVNSLILALQQLQLDCKRHSVMTFILRCIRNVLTACCRHRFGGNQKADVACWQKIYERTVRTVCLNHCTQEGHLLIQEFIKAKLIEPGSELKCFFAPGFSFPSCGSLSTLATLMEHSNIYKVFTKEIIFVKGANNQSNFVQVRTQLLDWLLPSLLDETGASLYKSSDRPSISLLGQVLAKLVNQDCHLLSSGFCADQCYERCLETFYLEATFNLDFLPGCQLNSTTDVCDGPLPTTVNHRFRDKLFEYLLRDCGILLDSALGLEVDVVTSSATCCLVAKCVGQMIKDCTVTFEELVPFRVCDVLQKLMCRLCRGLKNFCETDGNFAAKLLTLQDVLTNLQEMFSWHGTDDFCRAMSQFCREVTPQDLIAILIECLYGNLLGTDNQKSSVNSAQLDSDFDFFLDDNVPYPNGSLDKGFTTYYNKRRWFNQTIDGQECNFLLSDTESLKLYLSRVLTTWCQYPRLPLLSPRRPRAAAVSSAASSLSSVMERILKPLLSDSFDMDRNFNIELVFCVLGEFMKPSHSLDSAQLSDLLNLLRRMFKIHFKDGEIGFACLNLLGSLLQKLNEFYVKCDFDADLILRDHALHLLNAFRSCKSKGNVGSFAELGIAKVIAVLAKCDSRLLLLQSPSAANSSQETCSPYEISALLRSKSFSVTFYVSKVIPIILKCDTMSFSESIVEAQENLFKEVAVFVDNSSVSKDGALESLDCQSNLTSSCVAALAQFAVSSPACLKRSLFTMCRYAKNVPSSVALLKKVLKLIAVNLGYSEVSHFLNAYMGHLIFCCLEKNCNLGTYSLLWTLTDSTGIQEFSKRYYQLIVPVIFVFKRTELQEELSRMLERSWHDLVLDCFPRIMTFIIPGYVLTENVAMADNEECLYAPSKSKAESFHRRLEGIMSKEGINRQLMTKLDEVVVCLLNCLCCSPSDNHVVLPVSSTPFYGLDVISGSLRYIMTACNKPNQSLISVLCSSQDSIQKILLILEIRLNGTHTLPDIYQAVMAYKLFASFIWAEFQSGLSHAWAYVLHDVVGTLCQLLERFGTTYDVVTVECYELLKEIIKSALDVCHGEITKLIPRIISCVVRHATLVKNAAGKDKALLLLKFLVIEKGESLKETLALLEPFPDLPEFEVMRQKQFNWKCPDGPLSLKQEVSHFLKSLEVGGCSQRSESLIHLCQKLAQNRDQLKILFDELKGFRFSDEYSTNVLYCLFVELRCMCSVQNSSPQNILPVGRCLGELGPFLLPAVISLPVKTDSVLDSALKAFDGDPVSQRNVIIFHRLYSYLGNSRIELKTVTVQVLKQVLSTLSGQNFAKQYKGKKIDPLFNYLHPFCSKKSPSNLLFGKRVSNEEFSSTVDTSTVWSPEHCTFEKYVINLCCVLISTGVHECEILTCISPVCENKLEFCKELLPYLVHAVLSVDDSELFSNVISRQINGFFAKFAADQEDMCLYSVTSPSKENSRNEVYFDKRVIQVLLNLVQFLCLQKKTKLRERSKNAQIRWNDNYMLDLDYLLVALAAHFCSSHFSALMFIEIWYERKTNGSSESPKSSENFSNPLCSGSSNLSSGYPDGMQIVQKLLLKVYCSIGDPDAMYGCGTAHLTDARIRLQYYEHERRWDRATMSYDLALHESAALLDPVGLPRSLYRLGLQHLPQVYLESLCEKSQSPAVRDFQFECAWKMTEWREFVPENLVENDKIGFHELLYGCLCALGNQNERLSEGLVARCLRAVVVEREHDTVECASALVRPLTYLAMLRNIEDFVQLKRVQNEDVCDVLATWSTRDAVIERNVDVMEPVLCLRSSLLQLLLSRFPQNQTVVASLVGYETQLAKLARESGLYHCAESHVLRLRSISNLVSQLRFSWMLEEANIFWDRGEQDTAKSLINVLIKQMECQNHETSKIYARAQMIYGDWLIETRSDKVSTVIQNVFEKAILLLEKYERQDDEALHLLINAYATTAHFADVQYKRIVDYLKSSAYETKRQMVVESQEAVKRLKKLKNRTPDQMRSLNTLEKQSEIDKVELDIMHNDKGSFLLKVMECYLKCLSFGATKDLKIFRVVSLWFLNKESPDVNAVFQKLSSRIPSHKFLPLVYQLAARLGSCTQFSVNFQDILSKLIEKITIDHPYHTILVLLALSHSMKDENYSAKKTDMLGMQLSKAKVEETDRIVAARKILDKVQNKCFGSLVRDMEKLCIALISLSYWSPKGETRRDKQSTVPVQIDSGEPLRNIGRLEKIPPFTLQVDVDPSCNYDRVPTVVEYSPIFKYVGGINSPKQISCRASDGLTYLQLVKGNDDLRQDAVMQQVFGMVNSLLSNNSETAKRSLLIRTYKVIPLSQRSGILEWCSNTIPLSSVLGDIHARYYPGEKTIAQCRRDMESVSSASFQKKHEKFLAVCGEMRPVFRHFFFEKFPHPTTWFERRMAYTKSVATTSIVGYIMGLGDRHVSNILVDERTAEFIHIDFGIAFEQGRNLPTPETVPFRLTRDVVNGMGITGTEGTFRRCCEKTMMVMRNSQEVVLTLLEVLLYDPLYQWSMTPLKACKVQGRRDTNDESSMFSSSTAGEASFIFDGEDNSAVERRGEDVNKLAERALYRVQQKLNGTDDGTVLSVSGQVAHLIQVAIDSGNLCKLFCGWQAYL